MKCLSSIIALLGLGLIAGCASYENSEVLDFPDARAQQSLTVWSEQGFPTGTCAEEVGQLTLDIVPPNRIESDDYCGAENAGMNVLGCFFYQGTVPTIVLRSQMSIEFEHGVEHELRHWLAMCSGYDPSGDPEHNDPGVWYRTTPRLDWQYGGSDAE